MSAKGKPVFSSQSKELGALGPFRIMSWSLPRVVVEAMAKELSDD